MVILKKTKKKIEGWRGGSYFERKGRKMGLVRGHLVRRSKVKDEMMYIFLRYCGRRVRKIDGQRTGELNR